MCLQVIFSACELGVFDLLLRSPESLSAQKVSQELGTSVDGMERLLDALVGIEILDVEKTDGIGEEHGTQSRQKGLARDYETTLNIDTDYEHMGWFQWHELII